MGEGYLRVQVGLDGIYMPFDEEEERKVYWFVHTGSGKEWYQL